MRLDGFSYKATAVIFVHSLMATFAFANPKAVYTENDSDYVHYIFVLGGLVGTLLTLVLSHLLKSHNPIAFKRESIDFTIDADNVVLVEADYILINSSSDTKVVRLVYPFPEDSSLHQPERLASQQITMGNTTDIGSEKRENPYLRAKEI